MGIGYEEPGEYRVGGDDTDTDSDPDTDPRMKSE